MDNLKELIELDKDARKFGFDWPNQFMILDQIIDECRETREDLENDAGIEKIKEEVGDILHAVISLCVFSGFDVDEILSKTNKKFSLRMKELKKITKKRGLKNLVGKDINYMLDIWRKAKSIKT